jgi:hypothetical protein
MKLNQKNQLSIFALGLLSFTSQNAWAGFNRAACNSAMTSKNYPNPISPVQYWNFDSADPVQSKTSATKLSFIGSSTPVANFVQPGGRTGNFLSLNADAPNFIQHTQTDALVTGSFALEFSYQFKSDSFKYLGDTESLTLAFLGNTQGSAQAQVRMNTNSIIFSADTLNSDPNPAVAKIDTLTVSLTGLDRQSINYYLDGKPHHFVFNRNAELGRMEIWVDGVLASGFSRESTCGALKAPLNQFRFNQYLLSRKLFADMDNIAVYNTDLPEAAVVQHYLDFEAGRNPNFQYNPQLTANPAPQTVLEFDPLEYAPGSLFTPPTQNAWTEGVTVRPEVQLTQFPVPRYRPLTTPLRPNFNWMQPHFMAGLGRPWLYEGCSNCTTTPGRDAYLTEKIKLMHQELVLNWNYGISLHFFPARISMPIAKSALDTMLLYPEAGRHLIGFTGSLFYQPGVSNEYLLKDNNGNPFRGRVNELVSSPVQPYLDPNSRVQFFANEKAVGSVSASGIQNDSLKQFKDYLNLNGDARKNLTTLPTFDLINENGEFQGVNWWPEYISQDPAVRADERNFYSRSTGVSPNLVPLLNAVTAPASEPLETRERWDAYRGFAMARIGNAFRDSMLQKSTVCSPSKSCGTRFSLYSVQGLGHVPNSSKFYQQYRRMNSPYAGPQFGCNLGTTCYHSTADYYPNTPNRWRISAGNAHGINWFLDGRRNEIAAGDRMFTPFVNAHFRFKEEQGLRPGQYLGVLKLLGIMGVEHYYAGFFSTGQNIVGIPGLSFQDPKNWVWQVTTPSYAQAVSSRYEDVLRRGDLIDRPLDQPSDRPRYDFSTRILDSNGNEISDDPNLMTLVRKLGSKYVIATSVQRQSNYLGHSENQRMVSIDLKDGTFQKKLKFESRLQGSVYVYDVTNPNAPLFYQLDKWHEYKHPAHWSRSINLEAELFDVNQYPLVTLKTESANGDGDYRSGTTYLSTDPNTFYHGNIWISHFFQPRNETKAAANFDVWVKVRSKSGTGSLSLKVNELNRRVAGNLVVQHSPGVQVGLPQTIQTSSNSFVWIKAAQTVPGLKSNQNYVLHTRPLNSNIEIDQYVLSPAGSPAPND